MRAEPSQLQEMNVVYIGKQSLLLLLLYRKTKIIIDHLIKMTKMCGNYVIA